MARLLYRFRVLLRRGDDPQAPVRHFDIDTETRQLAAKAAEHAHPGWMAHAVSVCWDCAGACSSCGTVLFADDRPRRSHAGLRCRDCR